MTLRRSKYRSASIAYISRYFDPLLTCCIPADSFIIGLHLVYNRHRNYAIFIRCSQSDFTGDTTPDEKKKHVTSFGKGRKRRRLQLRQARAGQLATVTVAAPPVGPDSDSDANESNSDSRYLPVTSQVLRFYVVFFMCSKHIVISSVNDMAMDQDLRVC